MKHNWKRLLSVVLTLALVFSLLVPVAAATENRAQASQLQALELTPVDAGTLGLLQGSLLPEEDAAPIEMETHSLAEIVRVSIVLDRASTIGAGYAMERIAENRAARAYRDSLKAEQKALTSRIEASTGHSLDVKWNLTLAANLISANVRYGELEAIRAVPGVADVVIETRYELDQARRNGDAPNMGTSTVQIGSGTAWAEGYTGAGSRVAVIDTGADVDHQSFSGAGLDYALAQSGAEVTLLDAAAVDAVADQLNAPVSGAAAYHSAKIPYGYNYVDGNYDVTHLNDTQEEHGSHVAGIATANRFVEKDGQFVPALTEVGVQGVAPDAQLLVMKVFGKGGGAYDSDYMAAIEDAIVLGCDSANLSLGSGNAGMAFSGTYEAVMNKLVEEGMVVAFSAGNSYSWYNTPYNDAMYPYLYTDDVNYDTVGSPGSFTNSLTVASVDNSGQTGMPLMFGDLPVFYSETSGYGNAPIATLAELGTLEYVYVDTPGVDDNDHVGAEGDDFLALGSEVLSGKVAMCNRGSSSFFAKANAAMAQGAIGIVIVNNQAGVINMNLTGYKYTAPAVSITQADGMAIKAQSEAVTDADENVLYYTGTLTVSDTLQLLPGEETDVQTISSFSSWGTPGSLTMKPEIAAPGGSIYSVFGTNKSATTGDIAGGADQYELMSGTSMASPQVAGMAAVMGQYIRENDLEAKTGLSARQLTNSLLMSTAVPMYDDYGDYWPILQQGAGLANVGRAVSAQSYILMAEDATMFPDSARDGKVKAELGDDPARSGSYSYSFTVYPLSDAGTRFHFRTDLFTQRIAGNGGYGMLQDTATVLLGADVRYEVKGETYSDYFTVDADVNTDGETDEADARAILDKLSGALAEDVAYDEAAADVDGDGTVTTVDARLILESAATQYVDITEPTVVTVNIHMDADDMAFLNNYFTGGFYIEGYTYLEPDASDEGEILDVTHAIPILGFCGSWTDASMFDRSSPIGEAYGIGKLPYLANSKTNYLSIRSADGSTRVFMGNPYTVEEEFPADRLALNANDAIYQVNYLPIRNIGSSAPAVLDAKGKVLWLGSVAGTRYAPYYYVNGAVWMNYSTVNAAFNKSLGSLGLEPGDQATVGFYALPEYYAIQYAKENGSVASSGALDAEGFRAVLESGELGEGAGIDFTVTVDNDAPVLKGAYKDVVSGKYIVQAQDDRYIAYVGLLNKSGTREFASAVPEQTEPGQAVEVTLDTGGKTMPAKVLLLVGDYAGNEAAYLVDAGGGQEDLGGLMLGFTNADGLGSSGKRWLELDPDTLYYDIRKQQAEGISVYSDTPVDVLAADYVDGYVFMAAADGRICVSDLYELDSADTVGRYDDVTSVIYDMAYNTADGTLYALGEGNVIYSVDLITGALTKAVTVGITNPATEKAAYLRLNALAIDDSGTFYALNYGDLSLTYLYSFQLNDAVSGEIPDLSPVSEEPVGIFNRSYGGAMTWDHGAGTLYVAANYGTGTDKNQRLFALDTATGKAAPSNSLTGTEGDGCFYVCLNGLFVVPGKDQGIAPADGPTGVEADPAELHLLRGMTADLSVTVYPWTLEDKSVTFVSDDESIATVTADGVVTGVAEGDTSITVTTVAAPQKSVSVPVFVTEPPAAQFRGVIWDASGKGQASVFDTDKTQEWTAVAEVGQLRWGTLVDDVVYGSTDDTMYSFDADTYEVTTLGGIVSDWIPSDAVTLPEDMALAWELDASFRVGGICTNGLHFEVLDPEAGKMVYFDLSNTFGEDPMAVMADTGIIGDYVDTYNAETHPGSRFYYMMTESGMLWQVALTMDGGFYPEEIGPTGLSLEGVADVTNQVWASLGYDALNGFLYLAHYDGSAEVARLYAIDPADPARNTLLGDFNADVWPVTGLYQYEPATDLVLRVNATELSLYETQTAQVKFKVKLGHTNEYTITSSDASVAVMDETGLVTAVGEGTATITVTTVDSNDLGQQLSKSIDVTVKPLTKLDATLPAQISPEEGTDLFAALSLNGLSYTEITEAPYPVFSGARTGDIYMAGTDRDIMALDAADLSTPVDYPFDTEYYPLFPPMDIANYPMFVNADNEPDTHKALFTTDVDFLATPEYWGWDLSDYMSGMAGIAFAGVDEVDTDEDGEADLPVYVYYILTTSGTLYRLNIDYVGGYIDDLYDLIDTGIRPAAQSDLSMAYIQADDDSYAGLVVADAGTGDVWYLDLLAYIAEDWDKVVGLIGTMDAANVSGLMGTLDSIVSVGEMPEAVTQPASALRAAPAAPAVGDGLARMDRAPVQFSGPVQAQHLLESRQEVRGSLNAIRGRQVTAPQFAELGAPAEDDADDTMVVELSETEATRNGLLTVSYDPEELTFVSGDSALDYCSVHDDGAGAVTFTYASVDEIAAEEVLATIRFAYTFDEDAGTRVSVTVATAERGDDTAVSEEPTVVELGLYSQPVWNWEDDYSAATATFKIPGAEDTVLDAVVALDEEASVPAACEAGGQNVYVAAVTGPDGETYTDTQTEALPALGHAWDFAEEDGVVWAEDYSSVTVNLVCANDPSHTLSGSTDAITVTYDPAPTCTEDGYVSYDAVLDLEGLPVTVGTGVFAAATGHSYGDPSWTWADDCSMAVATFACTEGDDTVEKTAAVAADAEASAAPACEADGQAVYVATVTGPDGETYTDTRTVVLPAAGHAWGAPVWTWEADHSAARATFTCGNDSSHVKEAEAVPTADTTEPDCVTDGQTVYTATVIGPDGETYTDTRTDTLPATGHSYGEPTWRWSDDSSVAVATFTCTGGDDTVTLTAAVAADAATSAPAACETDGQAVYVATVTGPDGETYTDTKTVTLPATGHAWGEPVWTWEADHAAAKASFTCGNDATHVETLDATVAAVTDPAAACEAEGLSTFTATVTGPDGTAYTDQQTETLPALGHAWGTPEYVWAGDNARVTAAAVCGNDPAHELTETVETVAETTVAPKCESAGETTFTAAFTKPQFETQTKTVALPATGHAWGAPIFTWAEDYTAATLTLTCANDAAHTLEVELDSTAARSGMTTVYSVRYEMDGVTYADSRIVTTEYHYVQPAPKPTPVPQPRLFDDAKKKSAWFFDSVYWAAEKGVVDPETEDHFGVGNDFTRAETVTALWKALGSPAPASEENPFLDVSAEDECYKAVLWGTQNGVVKGVNATHFAPALTVTRGQAVTFLYRAAKGSAPADGENPFEDVYESDYYYDPILWAVSLGVTEGVDATHFAPQNTLTAGHIVTFLYRLYQDEV